LIAPAAPRSVAASTPAPVGPAAERWWALILFVLCAASCVWLLDETSALDHARALRSDQLHRLQAMRQDRELAAGPLPAFDGLFPDHRVVVEPTPAGNLLTVLPAVGDSR
jgi:hypothetical protein